MSPKSFIQFVVTIALAGLLVGLAWGVLGVGPSRAAPPVRALHAPGDCTVTNTNDSGPGSLRQCMLGLQPGATITFSTSVFLVDSPVTITLTSGLPHIITNNVTIDGSNAGVILTGNRPGPPNGIVIDGASNVVIKGLQIIDFLTNGIVIQNGATNNTIGGVNSSPGGQCSGDCNLISGNGTSLGNSAILIIDSGTTSNTVSGNYIGTDINGTSAISNQHGILIWLGAQYNLIGGDTPGERNLISGNQDGGIAITNNGTMYNTVSGNYIGTDVTGAVAIPNGGSGVDIGVSASYNTIGGTFGKRNLISGNDGDGVSIHDSGSMSNTVSGNYIGTNNSGTAAIPNNINGVSIDGASYNLIGGDTLGERNLISGNGRDGVQIQNSNNNTVSGNYIGTDVTGSGPLGNSRHGVNMAFSTNNNQIGGTTPAERNLISGNGEEGVDIEDGAAFNTIIGNYIGTDISGTAVISNGDAGVGIQDAPDNQIGGSQPGAGNLILGNDDDQVEIEGAAAVRNQVIGNRLQGPGGYGVRLKEDASQNRVAQNEITQNSGGVSVDGGSTLSNTISQNAIYSNTGPGIELTNGGNLELAAPRLTEVTTHTVKGQAPPNSTVEIFSDAEDEGRYFHGITATTATGQFTFTQTSDFTGTHVTATATDADGNTSEFSVNTGTGDIYLPVIFKNN